MDKFKANFKDNFRDNFKINFEGHLEGQLDLNLSTTSRTKSKQHSGRNQEQHQEQNLVQHQNKINTVGCNFIVISLVMIAVKIGIDVSTPPREIMKLCASYDHWNICALGYKLPILT